MKKRVLAVLVIMALVGSLAFAEGSFTNEFKSKIVDVDKDGNTVMGQTYEQMSASYSNDVVDIMAKGRFFILNNGVEYDPSNTYMRLNFKPGYGTFVGLNLDILIPGSYLYVKDDNVALGQIASSGVTTGYNGSIGDNGTLVAAATFGDWFNFTQFSYTLGAGAYYQYAGDVSFSLGANYKFESPNALSNKGVSRFGIFGSLAFAGLDICAGFTFNGNAIYANGNCINLTANYGADLDNASYFWVCADYVTNFDNNFYYGVAAGYGIPSFSDAVSLEVGYWLGVYDCTYTQYAYNAAYEQGPSVTINTAKVGSFKIAADFTSTHAGFQSVTFPVKWVYTVEF